MMFMNCFTYKVDDASGQWKTLHNKTPRDLCSSLSIVRVVKSMRLWQTRSVARMRYKKHIQNFDEEIFFKIVQPKDRQEDGKR
jgi:hypothetical protein